MKKRTRNFLFLLFLAAFLVITPVALLYAFGYFFDFSDFKLIKTGSLYLNSEPAGASIFLNGEDTGKKTPALLARLKPGQYQIELARDNAQKWRKQLPVSSHQVTEVRDAFLPPLHPVINVESGIKDLSELAFDQAVSDQAARGQKYLTDLEISFSVSNVRGNFLYFLQQPGFILFEKDLSGDQSPRQISINNLFSGDLNGQEAKIIPGPLREIAVITPDQKLHLLENNREFIPIKDNVREVKFFTDESKLLILSDNEIWVYYLSPTNKQPFHGRGDLIFLTRLSTPIVSLDWHFQGQGVIFSTETQIKLVEIDERNNRNLFDLLPAKEAAIFTDFKNKKIYFQTQEKVFSLKLAT